MFLDSFPDLDSYIGYIQKHIHTKDLPLKIMGIRNPKNGTYYSSSLLAEAYRDIPNPDLAGNTPIDTHFGKIGKFNSVLDTAKTYSAIRQSKDGRDVILQGDILSLNSHKNFPFKFSKTMILTHSCTTTNSANILCCPVLDESEIDQAFIDFYRGKTGGDLKQIRGNLLDNMTVNFVGLPVNHLVNTSQKMICAICFPFFVPRSLVEDKIPVHRLTYRALAYLQQRLAMFYFRDVTDSDDCRDM